MAPGFNPIRRSGGEVGDREEAPAGRGCGQLVEYIPPIQAAPLWGKAKRDYVLQCYRKASRIGEGHVFGIA